MDKIEAFATVFLLWIFLTLLLLPVLGFCTMVGLALIHTQVPEIPPLGFWSSCIVAFGLKLILGIQVQNSK